MALTGIDLNADLAEECGGDEEIFPMLSSANICCGAHAGGPAAMRTAIQTAVSTGVTIGAHVGYADRENFGRLPVDIAPEALYRSVSEQIGLLVSLAAEQGASVRYVKPHGALYHRIGTDEQQADAVVAAVADVDADLHLLVPNAEVINDAAARRGLACRYEYFADRGYNPDGTLVDRRLPGAMLTDPAVIVERALRWLSTGVVQCVDGTDVRVEAQSICLHGDEPEAIASARALRTACDTHGYAVRSWRAL